MIPVDPTELRAYRNTEYMAARQQFSSVLSDLRGWLDDAAFIQLNSAVSSLAVAAFALGVVSGE